jgi:hypothetical protein
MTSKIGEVPMECSYGDASTQESPVRVTGGSRIVAPMAARVLAIGDLRLALGCRLANGGRVVRGSPQKPKRAMTEATAEQRGSGDRECGTQHMM